MPAKLPWLNFPYFLGIVTFVQLSPYLYQVQCCLKVFSLLNVCVWLYSNEQTCRTLWHYWTLQHRKVILHGHVVEYGTKTIAISEVKYGCMWRCLPATYPAKAALPLSSSNNQLHSCTLSIAEKHGANNQQEQSKTSLTVQDEIHTSAKPIQQPNLISTSKKQSMGACQGVFPQPILWKQCRP
jgi:hypothetical protein